MSSNDNQRFLCVQMGWFDLPFDLTNSKFLSVLAILTHGFRIQKCVFLFVSCFAFFFFVVLVFCFCFSLSFWVPHMYLLAKLWIAFNVDARDTRKNKIHSHRTFNRSVYLARFCRPYTLSNGFLESNNTMKMSTIGTFSRDKNTSHKMLIESLASRDVNKISIWFTNTKWYIHTLYVYIISTKRFDSLLYSYFLFFVVVVVSFSFICIALSISWKTFTFWMIYLLPCVSSRE